MFLTFLLAQAQNAVPNTLVNNIVDTPVTNAAVAAVPNFSIWSRILESDPLVKLTLIVLLSFSIMCWAVILQKFIQIRSAQRTAHAFWHKFSKSPSIAEAANVKGARSGPMYEIFLTGNESLGRIKKATKEYSDYYRDYLHQRMHQAREEEMDRLEQYVPFLATTASVAPFIGLFGTVWGILTAFMAIARQGSSNLATVGPYIAEALVATAVGLFAAIPAVVAYNYFVGRIRSIGKLINIFIEDFLLKSEREITS